MLEGSSKGDRVLLWRVLMSLERPVEPEDSERANL